ARDKLIITGTVKDVKNTMKKWSIPLYARTTVPHAGYHRMPLHTITSATCYIDWIVPAAAVSRSMATFWDLISSIPIYEDESDTPPQFAIHIISPEDLLPELISDDSHEKDDAKDIDAMLKDYLSRSGPVPPWTENTLSWKYPHPGSISTPAKITATAAARMLFEQNEEEPQSVVLTEELTEEETYLPSGFTEEPAFLAKDRLGTHGAAYGTLMHKVMQYLDFKTDYPSSDFLREEIHTLHERNILTDDEEKAILSRSGFHSPVQDILAFLHGPLGKMARTSLVRKELPFSILLPAQLFYESCEPEENIFLQGVIDCLLEQDDKLIIIDYKTDFARTEEELIAHYAVQLNLYAYAIQRIYAMPVSHMYLWSFRLKKAIPIPFHCRNLRTI
ncbi:PD-(D/E)XK nuclease family protein, partial [Allisonella histaminiformans]